jgi:hypothetical protein
MTEHRACQDTILQKRRKILVSVSQVRLRIPLAFRPNLLYNVGRQGGV